MDGGIGFGRVRISLLFRSVELRLPPPQLGWDVGTFEFTSNTITSTFAEKHSYKLRMRTGGSSGSIKREQCEAENGQLVWNIKGDEKIKPPRLPVRYRYRSPIFFEFHASGKRHAEAFAAIWLLELVDNEPKEFDVPIWRCDNSQRLSQNYITEENFKNIPDLKLEEVGRLRFSGRFKAGTDRDHLRFVSDNDSRETIETWEACFAEGVRHEEVTKEVPPVIQELHDASLTQGRDVLATATEEEKQKWLAKDGTDWTGAFGKDPASIMNGRGGDDDDDEDLYESEDDSAQGGSSAMSSPQRLRHPTTDLGIVDGSNAPMPDGRSSVETSPDARRSNDTGLTQATTNGSVNSQASKSSKNPIAAYKDYKSRSRDLHRQHRGLMQWRPMRNIQFAKDEAKFAVRRVTKLGSLSGRQPDVETEV